MLPFNTARQTAKIKTLVDSGATENFISPQLATQLGVKTRQLPMPIDLKTVDGSTHQDGQLTQYCWLKITLGQKEETMHLTLTPSFFCDDAAQQPGNISQRA